MENVHPSLIEAMKLDAQSWKIGDKSSTVITSSGSVYCINSIGVLTGGSHLVDGRTAELSGAVYRRGGPIRAGHVVVGLCIEAMMDDEKVIVTSWVESIKPVV